MSVLPVYRNGKVVAWSPVDREDYDRLSCWRWTINTRGYAWRREGDGGTKRFYLHREVLGLPLFFISGELTGDHINGDRLDNRRSNLRICTRAENAQNRRAQPGTSSQFRGVCWNRFRAAWKASVGISGTTYNLGHFATEQEAADVVAAFRREHMPFSEEARLVA